jgi:cytochrome c oxidase subunit 1
MRYGPVAGPNPWKAKGLEWETSSPPPTENFEETPIVTEEAYAYARPAAPPAARRPVTEGAHD